LTNENTLYKIRLVGFKKAARRKQIAPEGMPFLPSGAF